VYRNEQGLVRINGKFTAPFKYGREVRQGDPHSGTLFTLLLEPFLLLRNHNLRDYELKILSSIKRTLVTRAHADDITVFIIKNEGIPQLLQNLMFYGAISGAILKHRNKTDFL
jgi:hypothetical protein